MKQVWQLFTYDLWGNEEYGWEVNDVYAGPELEFNIKRGYDYPTDRQFARACGAKGLTYDGDDTLLYATYKSGKPAFELRRIL